MKVGVSQGLSPVTFAVYEFPLYIIFAIWDLPLYIYERISSHLFSDNIFLILYSKGILILFFFLTIVTLKKVCYEFEFSELKTKACIFFWITSTFVIEPLFVISQYDIICVFFILTGLLYYLRNDIKKFILFFAIATTFKFFALFLFIPFLLYKEKRIAQVLVKTILVLSPLFICKLLFISDVAGRRMVADFNKIGFQELIGERVVSLRSGFYFTNEKTTTIYLSLFIISYVLFCLHLFFTQKFEKRKIPLISVISFALFFLCCRHNPYWIILLSPFTALLVFSAKNAELFEANILLETLFSVAHTIFCIYIYSWCYDARTLEKLILKNIDSITISRFLYCSSYVEPIALTLFITVLSYFIFMNYKAIKTNEANSHIYQSMIGQNTVQILLWIRLLINLSFCLAQIILPFIYIFYIRFIKTL